MGYICVVYCLCGSSKPLTWFSQICCHYPPLRPHIARYTPYNPFWRWCAIDSSNLHPGGINGSCRTEVAAQVAGTLQSWKSLKSKAIVNLTRLSYAAYHGRTDEFSSDGRWNPLVGRLYERRRSIASSLLWKLISGIITIEQNRAQKLLGIQCLFQLN